MALAVLNLCVSRKVFLKHKVSWNTVCGALQDLPWRGIWPVDNPVGVLNEHAHQLRPSVCTTRKRLGFMVNASVVLASSRRLIFGEPMMLSV